MNDRWKVFRGPRKPTAAERRRQARQRVHLEKEADFRHIVIFPHGRCRVCGAEGVVVTYCAFFNGDTPLLEECLKCGAVVMDTDRRVW